MFDYCCIRCTRNDTWISRRIGRWGGEFLLLCCLALLCDGTEIVFVSAGNIQCGVWVAKGMCSVRCRVQKKVQDGMGGGSWDVK